MILWVPAYPSYERAVCALLGRSATAIGLLDDASSIDDVLDELLNEGALHEARFWQLPGNDAASRLDREARFQITRTISIEPRDRDDPMIAVTIEALKQHPAEPVARLLHAAARNARGPQRRPADRR